MNKKQIQELVDLVNENQLTALEVEEKQVRIRIEKQYSGGVAQILTEQIATPSNATLTETTEQVAEDLGGIAVKSPLVGVFYDANGPEEEPFVTIGSIVKEGDVLCIIESMKVMNEISAPKSGIIKKILVKKGDLVEFEQPLFIVE